MKGELRGSLVNEALLFHHCYGFWLLTCYILRPWDPSVSPWSQGWGGEACSGLNLSYILLLHSSEEALLFPKHVTVFLSLLLRSLLPSPGDAVWWQPLQDRDVHLFGNHFTKLPIILGKPFRRVTKLKEKILQGMMVTLENLRHCENINMRLVQWTSIYKTTVTRNHVFLKYLRV